MSTARQDLYRWAMRFAGSLVSLLALVACSSDDTGGGDGAPLGDDPLKCMGGSYDACESNDDCESGNCHDFDQGGIKVCVAACTPNDPTTCHTQDGVEVRCNNKGLCRPEVANTCP